MRNIAKIFIIIGVLILFFVALMDVTMPFINFRADMELKIMSKQFLQFKGDAEYISTTAFKFLIIGNLFLLLDLFIPQKKKLHKTIV